MAHGSRSRGLAVLDRFALAFRRPRIAVTPEMVRAGIAEYEAAKDSNADILVARVYMAMEIARDDFADEAW